MTTTDWPGHAVLQLPVPALEPAVRARYERYDASLLAADPAHVHAHLTVLGPVPRAFTPAQEEGLARVAARAGAFEVVLDRVATFPDGLVHVRCADPAPVQALTAAVRAVLPGWPPYGGGVVPVPHVTIDQVGPDVTEQAVRAELAALLPTVVRVERLEQVWYRAHEVALLRSWRLGAPPPSTARAAAGR